LNIDHFKDFKVSLLSRPLRDWYQQQQEILAMLRRHRRILAHHRRHHCRRNKRVAKENHRLQPEAAGGFFCP